MRAPVFDFALAVDQEISHLSRQEAFIRSSRAKRLLEELLPLSRFAFGLKCPGNEVEVEAFENNGPIDGVIRVFRDGQCSELRVEVTYTGSYEDALRRELIWEKGSAPGRGVVYRDKANQKIVAVHPTTPPFDDITPLAKNIVDRFNKKCAKSYPKGTMLLIAFDDPTFFGIWGWNQLHEQIEAMGGLSGWIGEVHIINCGSNECQLFV